MNKKEFLEIPSKFKQARKDALRLEYLKTKAEGVRAIEYKERVQTSPVATANMYVELCMDLAKDIEIEEAELKALSAEAKSMIEEKLVDEVGDVMSLRYVSGLVWKDIEYVMNYSEASIYRFHRTGLSVLFPEE